MTIQEKTLETLRQYINKQLFIRIINFFFFYVGWGLCMQQASVGNGWLGPLVVAAMFLFHLAVIEHKPFEIVYVLSLALFGTFFDTIYMWTGFVTYMSVPTWLTWWAPPWLYAIWVLFGMSINHSLIWLKGRIWLSSTFGAGGACLSYTAGAAIGACTFELPYITTMIIIGAVWAILTPLSIEYSRWLKNKVFKP